MVDFVSLSNAEMPPLRGGVTVQERVPGVSGTQSGASGRVNKQGGLAVLGASADGVAWRVL
jgi:hypothetical protein